MADFNIAFKKIFDNEGGYSDAPEDGGNWTGGRNGYGDLVGTKYGISAPVLWAWLGKKPTVEDMRDMIKETAIAIYWNNYWLPMKGPDIGNQDVANSIADSVVNMGLKQAIILAQRAAGIPETGRMDEYSLNFFKALP